MTQSKLMKSFIFSLCENESHSVLSNSLWPHGLHSPWNSPGKNTEVGSLSLLQGIFPTQGSNPGLLHCRWILYQLSHCLIISNSILKSLLKMYIVSEYHRLERDKNDGQENYDNKFFKQISNHTEFSSISESFTMTFY